MGSVIQKNKKTILYLGLIIGILGILALIWTQLNITCGRNAYYLTSCTVLPTYTQGVYLNGINPLILDSVSLFLIVIGLLLIFLGIGSKKDIMHGEKNIQKNNSV